MYPLTGLFAIVFASSVAAANVTDDLVLISSGSFYMGQEGIQVDEEPMHQVKLGTFEIDRFETTIGDWKQVERWALENGYDFSSSSESPWGKPYWYFLSENDVFPMNRVNWYDAVKWCNAKSEYMGRTPVYYEDSSKTIVYRAGEIDLTNSMVDWFGVGYRLPTEEEWEKAARGGVHNKNYPWGIYVDGSKANYKLSGDPFDDGVSPVGYFDGSQIIREAGLSLDGENEFPNDQANKFGLYDVVGNVGEWCWDWYDEKWYSQKKPNQRSFGPTFAEGDTTDKLRIHRGGGYKDGPGMDEGKPLRLAFRGVDYPSQSRRSIGFRCVRTFVDEELWINAMAVGNHAENWFFLDWFGHYYKSSHDWIFHPDLGWVYPTGKGSYDNWIYFPECGWMWTARFAFPFFFNHERNQWYKILQGQSDFGWFESSDNGILEHWGRDYSR